MGSSSSRRARRADQSGSTTVSLVVASASALLMLVVVANVLVDLYARAALRAALDEGVRAGLVSSAPVDACQGRARESLDDLLRGPAGADVRVACAFDGDVIMATGEGVLPGWVFLPDWELHMSALGAVER